MRRLFSLVLSVWLLLGLTGCLSRTLQAPRTEGYTERTTRIHILAFPVQIEARACESGIASTSTWIPLWGIPVGFFTFGILVPMTTSYSCVVPTQ